MKRAGDIDKMIEILKRRESRAITRFKPIYRKRIEELQRMKEHCSLHKLDKFGENDYLQLN